MIGLPDVERLEADMHALRLIDYRQGGSARLDAVRDRMGDRRLMLDASAPRRTGNTDLFPVGAPALDQLHLCADPCGPTAGRWAVGVKG